MVEAAGQPAELYDIAGKNPSSGEPTRILGAVQHRDGTAWFYKMTGDDPLVAAQKPAFIEFLKSFRFGPGHAESHPDMAASLPAGHPDISTSRPVPTASASSTPAPAREGAPTWQLPAGWKEAAAGQFLFAKFTISGDGGAQAVVNVSTSVGEGGGVPANINRWRQQIGLPPADESQMSTFTSSVDVAGGKAVVVEMNGTEAASGQLARVVGVIVPQPGKTWFYKLSGNPDVVTGQKNAFIEFVRGVRY
jgi:hypothetical protein